MGSGKSKDLRARGRGFYRPAKKRNGRAQVGMCALPHETTSETDGPAKTIAIIRGSPERASKLSLTKSPTSQAGRGIWRSRSYPFHPGTRIGCVSAGLHPVTTSWSRASDGSLWDSRRLRKMPSSNTSPSNRKVGGRSTLYSPGPRGQLKSRACSRRISPSLRRYAANLVFPRRSSA